MHTPAHTHTDPPGPDESISAIPQSKTSIRVSWSPPDFSRDPLLLRYSLFFTTDNTLNYNSANSVPHLLPTFGENIMNYVLPNLEVGTDYLISVRASFLLNLMGENSRYVAASSTFGNGQYSCTCTCTCICTVQKYTCTHVCMYMYMYVEVYKSTWIHPIYYVTY